MLSLNAALRIYITRRFILRDLDLNRLICRYVKTNKQTDRDIKKKFQGHSPNSTPQTPSVNNNKSIIVDTCVDTLLQVSHHY